MAKKQKLKICLASSELTPLAKTGGLADVTSALAAYLHQAGHDVRVLLPCYARIDRSDLETRPVPTLSGMAMRMGSRQWQYSIDEARIPDTDVPVYLLRCPAFFGREGIYSQERDEYLRFVMLTRAAFEMCQRMQFSPHVFHANDWHTAMMPLYLRSVYAWDNLFAQSKSVLTIHNIGYQGMFPAAILPDLNLTGAEQHLHQEDLGKGVINFLKSGILYADLVTTVSPTYAREIQGTEYGMGLDGLLRERSDTVVGILNGVDYEEWDPAIDPLIPKNFAPGKIAGKTACKRALMREMGLAVDTKTPLIGIVTRLVGQKGIDLIERTLPAMMNERDFSLVVLGSGEHRFESFFNWMQNHFKGRVGFYRGYNNRLAHWIEAGSDMFLMPSLYEPCGLNQMYSLKYGTVPIVRETGGLADSVEQIDPKAKTGTGILFRDYDESGLRWAVGTALDLYENKPLWRKIRNNGMAQNFSWELQGEHYVELFRRLSKLT